MSAVLLTGLIVGLIALGFAGHVLSPVIHQLSIDARRPGGIIDRPESRRVIVRPPELERLEHLVVDAMKHESTCAQDLEPLLASLAHEAPGGPVPLPTRGRSRQTWLAHALNELERAYEVDRP